MKESLLVEGDEKPLWAAKNQSEGALLGEHSKSGLVWVVHQSMTKGRGSTTKG